MVTTTKYPSVPIPSNDPASIANAVNVMRQTIQLLIVNQQQPSQPTLTKASQIFSKKSDNIDATNTFTGSLATINQSISNLSQTVGNLQSSVAGLQTSVVALQTRMTSLENRVTRLEATSGTGSDFTSLEARVTAIERMTTHDVRVRTASNTLNNAVANGGFLRFDTVDFDSDNFASATPPFDHITIPSGLGGIYVLTAWASGSGNQSTTLGMGVLLNGVQKYSSTNQSISGPGSVSYILDCAAVEVLHMNDGDTLQLVNNSVTGGTNAFTSVSLAMVRIEVP